MPDDNKNRNTDESVGFRREPRIPIDQNAERIESEPEMDARNSRRGSADLPHGLPTDNLHPDGYPSRDVASGFRDLRRGEQPHLEHENMRVNDNRAGGAVNDLDTSTLKGQQMADQNNRDTERSGSDAGYDRPTGEKSRYDAEKEIPDPQQVERDREEAERFYKDKGKKDVA